MLGPDSHIHSWFCMSCLSFFSTNWYEFTLVQCSWILSTPTYCRLRAWSRVLHFALFMSWLYSSSRLLTPSWARITVLALTNTATANGRSCEHGLMPLWNLSILLRCRYFTILFHCVSALHSFLPSSGLTCSAHFGCASILFSDSCYWPFWSNIFWARSFSSRTDSWKYWLKKGSIRWLRWAHFLTTRHFHSFSKFTFFTIKLSSGLHSTCIGWEAPCRSEQPEYLQRLDTTSFVPENCRIINSKRAEIITFRYEHVHRQSRRVLRRYLQETQKTVTEYHKPDPNIRLEINSYIAKLNR